MRKNTNKPISTSQNFQLYEKNNKIINLGDWLFPDVRLFWDVEEFRSPKRLYRGLVEKYEKLVGISEKPVLMKTVGFPTAGAVDASEDNQVEFFKLLLENAKHSYEQVPFVYHEAFDQHWKDWFPIESHWGLFKDDRTAKLGSKSIWGLYLKQKVKNKVRISEGYLFNTSFTIILFFFFLFIVWMPKKFKNKLLRSKRTLRLMNSEKEVVFVNNGYNKILRFSECHNNCFDVLLLLAKNHNKHMSCGEILKTVTDDSCSSGCTFGEKDGCNIKDGKKSQCVSYKSLHGHRIQIIKEMIDKDYKIGILLEFRTLK